MSKQTLTSIFNDKIFNIPGYQRGYSWEDAQLKDFFKDLGWIAPGKQHFTGTLALRTASQGGKIVDVIDGQQRLTTSFILINALIRKAEKNGNKFIGEDDERMYARRKYLYAVGSNRESEFLRLKYHSEESNTFLKLVVESDLEALEALKPSNVYGRNLKNAAKFFENEIKSFSGEEIDRYFTLLTKGMTFQIEEVESEFDVCAMFESINYRGKKLSKFEVLKNRLIYLIDLIAKNNFGNVNYESRAVVSKNKIQAAWSTAYDQFGLGEEDQEVLDEDEFLSVHAEMYFGPLKKKKDALDDRLFKEVFSLENVRRPNFSDEERQVALNFIDDYVESIAQSAHLWTLQRARYLKEKIPAWLDEEGYKWLVRINRLPKSPFDSLILSILNIYKLTNVEFDLIHVLEKAERFIFIVYGLCDYSSKQSESEILDMAHKIYKNSDKSLMGNLSDFFEEIIFGDDDGERVDGLFNLELIKNSIDVRFTNERNVRSMGWRRWDSISYFLVEHEVYARGNSEFVWDDEYACCEIEHIYPMSILDDGKNSSFKEYIGNKKKLKCYINDLGNLVVLEGRLNTKAKDLPFKRKKDIYVESNLSSVRRLLDANDWSVKTIENRGVELLKFMKERWDIPIEEDSEFQFNMLLAETFKPPRSTGRKK